MRNETNILENKIYKRINTAPNDVIIENGENVTKSINKMTLNL